jgi:hypothetical protein
MLRPSVLLVTLLVNAPSLWAAFGRQTAGADAALLRLVISLPIVAVLVACVRTASRPREPAALPVEKQHPTDR